MRQHPPTFSKDHFDYLAGIISCAGLSPKAHHLLVTTAANRLGATNPQFDRAGFIINCSRGQPA